MVRTAAGRSRGCQICRKRRIKCDETLPECTQCQKNGRKCPGPITGTFYVIASEACTPLSTNPADSLQRNNISRISRSDYQSRRSDSSNETLWPAAQHSPSVLGTLAPRSFNTSAPAELSNNIFLSKMLSYYQPSRAEPFEQLFFSHFFDACGRGIETAGACSWLSKLPGLLAASFSSLTIKYSARATCMAFYGILNGEVSIQTEARKAYTKALEIRRAELCLDSIQHHASKITTSEESICATVMMGYFELVLKTTPLAWMQHLEAASAMLRMIGPEGCQSAFIHQLFRTVRYGVAFASVVLRTPHIFAEERWKTIPFLAPKTQLDNLVDILLSIPDYIVLADRMIYKTSTLGSQESQHIFGVGLSVLISNLDTQTQEYGGLPPRPELSFTKIANEEFSSRLVINPDLHSGCLAAIRHASYLICFSLLASTDAGGSVYQAQAIHHSEAVLCAVDYVDSCSQSRTSSLFMTTVFALNVISSWSPSPMHQAYALKKLENSSTESFT